MKKFCFSPTYVKDNGLITIYNKTVLEKCGFNVNQYESGIVVLPPGSIGGNHKHDRIEAFYSLGDLTISWKTKNGRKKTESMAPDGREYKLFVSEKGEPHAIINNSKMDQILVEFASGPQVNVEQSKII